MAIELISTNPVIDIGVNMPVVNFVNEKTGNVTLTAKDVGAIGTEDLSVAVNEALAQAKESGDFDGKDGADGKDGIDGKDYVLTDEDKEDIAEVVESGEVYKELSQTISEAETNIDNISNQLFVRNLINLQSGEYEAWTPENCNGVATVVLDNQLTINHTSHEATESTVVIPLDIGYSLFEGQTYTLSIQNIAFENYTGYVRLRLLDTNQNIIKNNDNATIIMNFPKLSTTFSLTFTALENKIGYINLVFAAGVDITNLTCNIQLEAGNTMTEFQSPDQMLKLEPLDKSVTEAKLSDWILNKINTPLTTAYKTEIANQVIELLPSGDEVSY